MADVILAEDDRVVRNTLAAVLEKAGHSVRAVRDGARALASFEAKRPDAVILDVMMPVMDGREACRRIREVDAETPVLFLTALDTEADELEGLGLGADDYVSKSASDEILLARLSAALRRVTQPQARGDFDLGPWRIDASSLSMSRGRGRTVELSEREVALLRLFASRPGEVFSRDFLLTRFWEGDADASDNALSIAMFNLREKLGDAGAALRTVRGAGYAYRPPARG